MKIGFTLFGVAMNHTAIQIAIIILIPAVAGFFTKKILRSIKLKNGFANFLSVIIMLLVYFKTLMIVLG